MNKNLKRTILSGAVIGALLLIPKWKSEENPEGIVLPSRSVEVSSNLESLEYEVYDSDTVDYIGTINVSPSIYTLLKNQGYYSNDYNSIDKNALDTYQYQEVEHSIGEVTTGVHFRMGPSTDYDILNTLPQGAEVSLIAKSDNNWYLVQYENQLGFVSGDFIHEVDFVNLRQQVERLPDFVPAIQATSDVNIRANNNTNSEVYSLLKKGQVIKVLGREDNGWFKVLCDKKIGYICGDYVKDAYMIDGECKETVLIDIDFAILYRYPYQSKMDLIEKNQIVKVYGETDSHYYVEFNGKVGYLKKSDCKTLSDTFVVVDISDQQLTLYHNDQEILSSSVVTGKDSSPSDVGLFTIYTKERNATLTGPGYSSDVSYWMPYNDGEGLHDASWRSSFGGNIYHDNGSHGCVNLPTSVAGEIYENVSVGDKVLVKE